jgi:hypothetical protein
MLDVFQSFTSVTEEAMESVMCFLNQELMFF